MLLNNKLNLYALDLQKSLKSQPPVNLEPPMYLEYLFWP